jgi:outer membrane protein assembly factor BamB
MSTETSTATPPAAPEAPPPPSPKAPGGYATRGSWVLRTLGVMLLLAGALHLQAASIQTAVTAPPPGYTQPGPWLDGSVSMVVLAFALAIISWFTFRDVWRLVVPSITLVASLVVEVVVLLTMLIESGPAGGAGLRGPLAAVGLGLTALAAICLIAGHRGRMRRARRWSIAAMAIVTVLGVAAVTLSTQLWLPNLITNGNTVVSETSAPAPSERVSTLEGGLQWNLPSTDRASGWQTTDGGLVATTGRGLTMTDPATGKVRWAQLRYDAKNVDLPKVSTDGAIVAVTGRLDRSENVLFNSPPTRWLWVFDAVTGQMLVSRAAPDERASLRAALAGNWLLWSKGATEDDPATMTATRFDGTTLWVSKLPETCGVRDAQNAPGDRVLAMLNCRSEPNRSSYALPNKLLMFEASTGKALWTWTAPTFEPFAVVGKLQRGVNEAIVATARNGHPEYTLAAIRLSDGSQAWLDASHDGPEPDWASTGVAYRRSLVTAGRLAVLTEATFDARALELRAIEPSTGITAWSRKVPMPEYERSTIRWVQSELPDGRLVLGILGSPPGVGGEAARDFRLRLVTVQPASGEIASDTTIPVATNATVPADILDTPRLKLTVGELGLYVELLRESTPFLGASIE